jgi:putative sigma-54 modulation protein
MKTSFKHVEPTDVLKNYLEEKSARLNKYFDGRISISWTISFENQSAIAHCHVVGNHMDYFGESEAPNFFAAIDFAIDKIERQVRKHKEVVRDHIHKHKGGLKKAS